MAGAGEAPVGAGLLPWCAGRGCEPRSGGVVSGATAVPATASTGSVDIRKVPCTGATFNVYYGANSVACYEGTGELPVQLPRVHQVTTGETTGYFTVISHGALAASNFAPREIISYPVSFPTLTLIDITGT